MFGDMTKTSVLSDKKCTFTAGGPNSAQILFYISIAHRAVFIQQLGSNQVIYGIATCTSY